ncbi:diphosphomevalonate decarboxylase isoform X2 [Homalodisca vitripennis]|uniref:diphosphomevalonate decarboxylase isoform X2 n=1 Tax=Homalodisca vitripennis TaxID=197043 RepID=UPI001EEBBF56|nr:diphosphomevalonate decarboxylase isoform X2 [Homalodisca vitripennis]
MSVITCIAPVNIAIIKYWGKRDEDLILPLNDSISTTLSMEQMRATTTIMQSPDFDKDRIWLNGKEESFDNPRLIRCLTEMRRLAGDSPQKDWKIHICSENNFPTAAGLASSAAGYACLVYTLSKVLRVEGDVTAVARQGSGSACRSLAGGFVHWARGDRADGTDSIAKEIFPLVHWPSLRVLILVVTDKKKKVSSTSGMQRCVETSELLQYRVSHSVPRRVQDITKAIASKDFRTFAEVMMKDSNQFHATALDSFPPAVYMNDVSHSIAEMVHTYNNICGSTKLAYTFDAGPNACLYLEAADVPEVVALVTRVFPPSPDIVGEYVTGLPVSQAQLPQNLRANFEPSEAGLLQYCILTELGSGPKELTDPRCHLLAEDGTPKHLTS